MQKGDGFMETHFIELSPANKECDIDFCRINEESFKGKSIFKYAEDYANASDSFKRTGKKMEILEIRPKTIRIRIISETSLQMVSKSLSGFSRELIRIDGVREDEGKDRLFADCIYNHSLFKSTIVADVESLEETAENLSNASALKMCVDLFYGDTTKTKEQFKARQEAKTQIKKILLDYKNKMEN